MSHRIFIPPKLSSIVKASGVPIPRSQSGPSTLTWMVRTIVAVTLCRHSRLVCPRASWHGLVGHLPCHSRFEFAFRIGMEPRIIRRSLHDDESQSRRRYRALYVCVVTTCTVHENMRDVESGPISMVATLAVEKRIISCTIL
jgi:hypothetical protein